MTTDRYYFDPSMDSIKGGVVTIVAPVGPADADLRETGPAFYVRRVNGIPGEELAYLDELTPLGTTPEPGWGPWWDAEDHESSGASQHYIETGRRQTRRESWEHSIHAERAVLSAELVVRRTSERITA